MEIRAARDSELEELIELQVRIFRPRGHERFRSYVREDPTYTLDQSRIVVDNGRIVSHLRIWDRLIRVRGVGLRAGGIGAVMTRPECQGQGYAGALMKDTDHYMFEAGYDLSFLFSIIGTKYYGSLGWTAIPLPTFKLALRPDVHVRHESQAVRQLEVERDLDAVAAMYEHCSKDLTGPEIRSRGYWTTGPSRHRGVFPPWGVERNGSLVAYLSFDVEAERIWVKEACALTSFEAAYADLAPMAVRAARDKGLHSVEGSLMPQHPLVGALAEATGSEPVWGEHDEMMVKLVNWESLTEKLRGGRIAAPRGEDEKVFWQRLFGVCPSPSGDPYAEWLTSLPECVGPFYWWTDIF